MGKADLCRYGIMGILFLLTYFVGATFGNSYQQDIVVKGAVFCDTSPENPFSDSAYFLPGVLVSVECSINNNRKWKSGNGIVSIQGETDENGEFTVQIPIIHNINPIRSCSVNLLESPHKSCNIPSILTSSHLTLSTFNGIDSYVSTPLSYRPSTKQQQQVTILSLPHRRALQDSTSKAKSAPPPLPSIPQIPKFSFPPLSGIPQIPKFSLPPLSGISQIPKFSLPPFSGIPQIPKFSLPPLSGIPQIPKFSLPPLSGISQIPKFSLPPLSGIPQIPKFSLPPLSGISQIPKFSLPPLSGIPQIPKFSLPPLSGISQIPKFSLPPLPGISQIPKFSLPPLPGIPQKP